MAELNKIQLNGVDYTFNANKATADANGNNIVQTYATKTEMASGDANVRGSLTTLINKKSDKPVFVENQTSIYGYNLASTIITMKRYNTLDFHVRFFITDNFTASTHNAIIDADLHIRLNSAGTAITSESLVATSSVYGTALTPYKLKYDWNADGGFVIRCMFDSASTYTRCCVLECIAREDTNELDTEILQTPITEVVSGVVVDVVYFDTPISAEAKFVKKAGDDMSGNLSVNKLTYDEADNGFGVNKTLSDGMIRQTQYITSKAGNTGVWDYNFKTWIAKGDVGGNVEVNSAGSSNTTIKGKVVNINGNAITISGSSVGINGNTNVAGSLTVNGRQLLATQTFICWVNGTIDNTLRGLLASSNIATNGLINGDVIVVVNNSSSSRTLTDIVNNANATHSVTVSSYRGKHFVVNVVGSTRYFIEVL